MSEFDMSSEKESPCHYVDDTVNRITSRAKFSTDDLSFRSIELLLW